MKVLVTGGAGFIGTHVGHALERRGHQPIVFDRAARPQSFFESFFGDIRDATHVTEAVAHADAVIHLAGVLGTQETIANPYPATETNVLGGLNVFQAVAQYKLPCVYIAVGNHWMQNTYSISKTTVERFAHMFNEERGTNIKVVRARTLTVRASLSQSLMATQRSARSFRPSWHWRSTISLLKCTDQGFRLWT